MGRYDSIYSDEQREALARAVLEDGLTAREAVEKAAAGELDTPAFDIPLSTAQGIVTQAKRQGTLTGLRDRLERSATRLVAIVESEAEEAEKEKQKGHFNHVRVKRAALTAQQVQKLVASMEQNPEPVEPAEQPRPAGQPSDGKLIERMADDMGKGNGRGLGGSSETR